MAVFTFVVYVLAVARLTRLVNHDTILDPVRITVARVFGPDSAVVYFLGCPWCVGMWLSLATAILPVLLVGLPWWWFILVGLATSHVIGLAAPLAADEDMDIETVEEDV